VTMSTYLVLTSRAKLLCKPQYIPPHRGWRNSVSNAATIYYPEGQIFNRKL
jgi:hypothetical protein